MTAIETAIQKAGSQSALAKAIGVTPQAVQQWTRRGFPPAERVMAIVTAVDGVVSQHDLRPDVFGPAPHTEVAA